MHFSQYGLKTYVKKLSQKNFYVHFFKNCKVEGTTK